MANVYAVKSGNWSDTTVWNTGALPTSADDVYSNTFTVTIDVSPTVLSIRNGSATGVTQGGSFSITANGITLTLTGSGLVATGNSANVLNVNNSVGTTVNLIFNSMSMTVVSQSLASFTGSGTLNITGNITVTSSIWANGFYLNGTGTVNITGDLTASPSSSNGGGPVFAIANTNTVNITGALNANLGFVISHGGTGQCTHIGSVNASNGKYAIAGTGRYVLSGPFLTSSNGKNPVIAENWFWANSNVTPTYYQIRTANLATIRPLYTADSVGGNPAASNVRSGTIFGPNNELTGTCAVPPAGSVALGVPVDNTTGTAVLTQANFQSALDAQGLTSSRTAKLDNLDTTVSSRLASASYTAPLDAAGTRTAVGLATANLDTQFNNIPANVRTNLSPELGRIDTTVSSRLATSGYTTPPTVGDIATAVWNAATSALSNLGSIGKLLVDNINATISSRLASASYQAPLDAAGTRTAVGLATANLDTQLAPLPNLDTTVSSRLSSAGYTTPPTATQNASAVRTELSTELARIDTTVSSRLAGASYQSPLDASGTRAAIGLASANLDTQLDALPTAVENASAVRAELTPELNNLDAAVSTRSTFNPATDTVANVTLVDTTTNLTNPPDVPTTTEIADAVRVELTPELSHLDADVTSRLAAADYTTPPTALENAQAVEVQLSLPLGNMDVAVSTRSTFDPEMDTVANVTLVDTTTNLTNPPVVPTPEQIAEAVRVELEPELSRVENCATVATTGQQIQNAFGPL